MIVVFACFCVFAVVFTLGAVVDQRDPGRLTRRYRHLTGGTENAYAIARRARIPLDAPAGSRHRVGLQLHNA